MARTLLIACLIALGLGLSACAPQQADSSAAGLTGAALVTGESCEPSNAAGVATRLERALLDTIAFTEGTRGRGKDGYNVTFGYRYFDNCNVHPNIKVCSGSLCSTAAGRYQFLNKTYVGLKMDSFWPEDQERGALELIERRGVTLPTSALTATQFANALDKLSYEWSSLPPGRYGTPRRTLDEIRAEYCNLAHCGVATTNSTSSAGFIAIERDGILYRYRNDGAGHFSSTAVSSGWESVVSMGAGADYDEDGEQDFLAVDFEYGLEVDFGDGQGDYLYSPLTFDGEGLVAIGAAADYDRDGHADFVATDDSDELFLARGDGTGQFTLRVLSTSGDEVLSIGGGADYTGDGRGDFVTLRSDGTTLLYAGDGTGHFSVRALDLGGSELAVLGGGADYTGDGLPDLIATAADGTGYLYVGQGGARFEARSLGTGWDWIRFID
jgi:muramidase (phage lysozyme)